MNLVGEKGQKLRKRLDVSGSQQIDHELSSSHQASQSGANVIQKQPVTKQKRKEFLVRDPCGQRVMGVTQGKMKQE